jgi:hypothetical protein
LLGSPSGFAVRTPVCCRSQGVTALAYPHTAASRDACKIAKSLKGTWRAEHLFALKQALGAFDFVGTQLAECDVEIEQQLKTLQAHEGAPA